MLHLFEELPESFPTMLEVIVRYQELLHPDVLGLKDQTKGKTQERTIIIFVEIFGSIMFLKTEYFNILLASVIPYQLL